MKLFPVVVLLLVGACGDDQQPKNDAAIDSAASDTLPNPVDHGVDVVSEDSEPEAVVSDGAVDADQPDASQDSTRDAGSTFAPPDNHVLVSFAVNDTANKTYDESDGLAWKGSFGFDPKTRIMTHDGSWTGPFVMLHDDGPWTEGGHEPEGATADDSIWSVAVWAPNAFQRQFEYGAISGSSDGSDGSWIWIGSNGTFTITAGASTPITAPGLTL